jgi:hypothetical protein
MHADLRKGKRLEKNVSLYICQGNNAMGRNIACVYLIDRT